MLKETTHLLIFSSLIVMHAGSALGEEKLTYSWGGTYVGTICKHIVAEAHKRIGIKFESVLLPTKRSLLFSNAGKADGEVCRIGDLEKKFSNLIRIDPSFMSMTSSVYSTRYSFEVDSWKSLSNYNIGYNIGHIYAENGTKGMDTVELPSSVTIIKMLLLDRIDVAVIPDLAALKTLHEMNLQGKVNKHSPPIYNAPLYLYVHKKNKKHIPIISYSIREVVKDGTANKLIRAAMQPYK